MDPPECPLCLKGEIGLFHRDRLRSFFKCLNCQLVFVPPQFHISEVNEKERYDLHQNSFEDQNYRDFLGKFINHLIPHLQPGAYGLDYGSGPVPVLSMIMAERGFTVDNYDLYYSQNISLLHRQYDFLTCTETVEHFRSPLKDWMTLTSLVKKGGWIGIMTELVSEQTEFASWHYKGDPTHLCFYSKETLLWLANYFQLKASFIGSSVVLLVGEE
jgi:hypothetical protein